MALVDQIRFGKVIIFDSLVLRDRKAFCINYNIDEEIVYRGIFGLKAVPLSLFLDFANVKDVFNYSVRKLTRSEENIIKVNYKRDNYLKRFRFKSICEFIRCLYANSGLIEEQNVDKIKRYSIC